MKAMKKATKKDFDKAVDEFCKFSKEVFAGSDENRKLQLLDGMKSLMNPKSSVKRPIEVTGVATEANRPIEVTDIDFEAKRSKLTALKLPNEMWMKILSYLKNEDIFGNFALVNKHFRALTLDPCAVKSLHLVDYSTKAKSMSIYKKWMKVIKRSRTLVELKITDIFRNIDWNGLIEEVFKSNPNLKSLTIDSYYKDSFLCHAEALKLAKNIQHILTINVIFSQDLLDKICELNSVKTVEFSDSGFITPKFIENLALSNNPIEYFYTTITSEDVIPMKKALHMLFEKKKHSLKMLNDNFGLRFDSENVTNHEECMELPNYNQCKNLEYIKGQFHEHDLPLISDLPKLNRLRLRNFVIDEDASYLKQFHRMNFSNLEYLQLIRVITTRFDTTFRELAKISFPSLKRLTVTIGTNRNANGVQEYEVLTEKTLECFIKRVPTLISIHFDKPLKSISQKFFVKIFKENNVLLLLDHSPLYGDNQMKMEKFLKRNVDSSSFKKYKSMMSDFEELRCNGY